VYVKSERDSGVTNTLDLLYHTLKFTSVCNQRVTREKLKNDDEIIGNMGEKD
jgi:hypothetical protein